MADYDFQNDLQNDAARKNYDAAMNGENRKGLDYFEKPHLWDEEKPCDIKDIQRENFVPIPTLGTGDAFKSYSLLKKIAVVTAIVVAVAVIGFCTVTYFMDGGGKFVGFGTYPFW